MPVARFQANMARSRFEAAIRSLGGDFESTLKDGRVIQFSVETASGSAVISAINEYPAIKPGTYRLSYYEPEDEELVLVVGDMGFFELIQRIDGTLDFRYYDHTSKPITVTFTRIQPKQES